MLKEQYRNYVPPPDSKERDRDYERAWFDYLDPIEAQCIVIWSEQVMNTITKSCDIHPYTSSPCESLNSEMKAYLTNRIEYWKYGIERMMYVILRHNYSKRSQLHDLYNQLVIKIELPLDDTAVQEYIETWVSSNQHQSSTKKHKTHQHKKEYVDKGDIRRTDTVSNNNHIGKL
jgi:hypothetical protein